MVIAVVLDFASCFIYRLSCLFQEKKPTDNDFARKISNH